VRTPLNLQCSTAESHARGTTEKADRPPAAFLVNLDQAKMFVPGKRGERSACTNFPTVKAGGNAQNRRAGSFQGGFKMMGGGITSVWE